MPQVNLANLSGQELRQLLDASRGRGDAALSYKVLQEMAARREGHVERGPFMTRRAPDRRLVPVELGEPARADDDDDLPPLPAWRLPVRDHDEPPPPPEPDPPPALRRVRRKPPPAVFSEAEAAAPSPPATKSTPPKPSAPPRADPPRADPPPEPAPLRMRDIDDEPPGRDPPDNSDWNLQWRPSEPPPPPAPRGSGIGLFMGFASGVLIGAALGWWASGIAHTPPPRPAPVQTAALAPPPAPQPEVASPTLAESPQVSPGPAAGPPPAAPVPQEAAQEPAPETPAAEAAAQPERSAPIPEAAAPTPEPVVPAANPACAAQPSPADREICSDPQLRRLQRELRRVYAEALDAHVDRELLRQRQLAWRDSRNAVTDHGRLAQLYEERIRKLTAATAAARSHH